VGQKDEGPLRGQVKHEADHGRTENLEEWREGHDIAYVRLLDQL
jgi:hypothetical protein